MSVIIIAEAGVNHNRDLDMAFKLVDAAKEAGADIVKFQAGIPEEVVTNTGIMAPYQVKNIGKTESQLEMIRKLSLDLNDFSKINQYCIEKNITFLATSFGETATKYLSKLNMPFWKIPSGEITNLPYLRKIAAFSKPTILSTGMSNLGEIEAALEILINGGLKRHNITILHCTTQYPTSYEDVNLNAMVSLSKTFNLPVGYSDHTLGIEIPIAAVSLGANIIEKHLTLDKNLSGPDHKASLEPKEFSLMVNSIRNIEKSLGDGVKRATSSESLNIPIARRSIVASKFIKKGDYLTEENITVKRPGTGISPMHWDSIINKRSKRAYDIDDLITW